MVEKSQHDSFDSIARSRSLSTRLFISVVLWLVCAVIFTGYTLVLSWELENGGVAINDAGSLRKRTFQMALLHNLEPNSAELRGEQAQFEGVLHHLARVGNGKLFLPDNLAVQKQVSVIERSWHDEILPLYADLTARGQTFTPQNRALIDQYAHSINDLVKLIELDNTQNIQLLRVFQMLLIAMTVVTAVTGIYLLFRLVISPLDTLRVGIARLSDGDLNSRVRIHTQDEFGLVSKGFNQMAQRLQDLYVNLEQKVSDKTLALALKNHELSSLYGVTAFVHDAHTLEEMSTGFIERVMRLCAAQAGSVRILDATRQRLDYVASIGLDEALVAALRCTSLEKCCCGAAVQQSGFVLHANVHHETPKMHCIRDSFVDVALFPICFHTQQLGLFSLYFERASGLDEAEVRLIEALCSQLGVAIENQRLIARDRQFAVSEERNLMAQGLHDSIAQSLSFLNLQVQMLDAALKNGQAQEAQENLAFIKSGVQESYEDVRELLLNFRTRLVKQDFGEALQTLLIRFEQHSGVPTHLSMEGDGAPLSPQQQLQVVFIVQEALSNVRKHAQAQRVELLIHNQADFVLRISDDGIGFEKGSVQSKRSRHVGTAIMHERAQMIHAHISIVSALGQGTQVELILPRTERIPV